MDHAAVLASYDEQVRRRPTADGPGGRIERDAEVIRTIGAWSGIGWSDLSPDRADAVIAAQVARFAELRRPFEWKHFSHDSLADLPDRLLAAGFVPDAPETLLVAEIAGLRLDDAPPAGVELVDVVDRAGVDRLVAVHDEVFGGDHSAVGRAVLAGIANGTAAAVLAVADGVPVAGARVELPTATEFAGLWGGGTVAAWRGRGVFRALVGHRARLAHDRGYRYLHVDATPDSRPVLRRLGFVELATTTPFQHR